MVNTAGASELPKVAIAVSPGDAVEIGGEIASQLSGKIRSALYGAKPSISHRNSSSGSAILSSLSGDMLDTESECFQRLVTSDVRVLIDLVHTHIPSQRGAFLEAILTQLSNQHMDVGDSRLLITTKGLLFPKFHEKINKLSENELLVAGLNPSGAADNGVVNTTVQLINYFLEYNDLPDGYRYKY